MYKNCLGKLYRNAPYEDGEDADVEGEGDEEPVEGDGPVHAQPEQYLSGRGVGQDLWGWGWCGFMGPHRLAAQPEQYLLSHRPGGASIFVTHFIKR